LIRNDTGSIVFLCLHHHLLEANLQKFLQTNKPFGVACWFPTP
jgi:hypothetical protein